MCETDTDGERLLLSGQPHGCGDGLAVNIDAQGFLNGNLVGRFLGLFEQTIEYFNGKLRDELLDREIFTTLFEAKVLIGNWRREYNTVRPHSSLGYKPPAPETIILNNDSLLRGLTQEVVQ